MPEHKMIRLEVTLAEAYIKEHWDEQLSWEVIGKHVGMSGDYLSRLFQKSVHMTLHENVTEYRLREAARLLTETTAKIKDISYRTGMGNPSWFSRKFSEKYGVTPREYRRMHQGRDVEDQKML